MQKIALAVAMTGFRAGRDPFLNPQIAPSVPEGHSYLDTVFPKEKIVVAHHKKAKPWSEYIKGESKGKPALTSNPKKAAKRAKKAKAKRG